MSHKFEQDAAGNLVHFIQDEPRAWVAAANVEAYRESWPEAADAIAPATKASAPAKPAKPAKTPQKAPAVKPKGKAGKGAR